MLFATKLTHTHKRTHTHTLNALIRIQSITQPYLENNNGWFWTTTRPGQAEC